MLQALCTRGGTVSHYCERGTTVSKSLVWVVFVDKITCTCILRNGDSPCSNLSMRQTRGRSLVRSGTGSLDCPR